MRAEAGGQREEAPTVVQAEVTSDSGQDCGTEMLRDRQLAPGLETEAAGFAEGVGGARGSWREGL